jgi:hypothetical protein
VLLVPFMAIGGLTAGALPIMAGIMVAMVLLGIIASYYLSVFDGIFGAATGAGLLFAIGYAVRQGWNESRQWVSEMWNQEFWRTRI